MELKKYKQLLLCTIILCIISLSSSAQNSVIIKYFDSLWSTTSKDSAFYFTEMVKEDTVYKCSSYWMKSKKLNCKSAFVDTSFSKPRGGLFRYYENGQIEDSSSFYDDGQLKNNHHYYPNGKLWVYYSYDSKSKKSITEAFDTKNNKIEDFIYMKDASFQESVADWQTYLSENIKSDIPIKNGAPIGTYQVFIRFIIDKKGKIKEAYAETNLGYGMETEGIRVIKKSPKWNPAILMGKPSDAYRRQPLTFKVSN